MVFLIVIENLILRNRNLTIIFYCISDLAFRGHRDEAICNLNFDSDKNYFKMQNEGNFIGLVKLLAGENADLANHLRKCRRIVDSSPNERYLTFLSNKFIYSTLNVVQNMLVRKIVIEIQESGNHFGIMMDTTTDVSSKSQCSVAVRYVNPNNDIMERTISFFESKYNTGQGLYNSLDVILNEIGLSTKNIVGHSFDGASAMRCTMSDFLKKDNDNNIYVWCYSHRFNLIISDATRSSTNIKFVLGLAEETAKMFRRSYKKMDVWVNTLQSIPNIDSRIRLKLIGQTRWSFKQDAISNIVKTEFYFYALIKTLARMCCSPRFDYPTLTTLCSTLSSWLNYEYILRTLLLHKVFCLLMPTTKCLQTAGLDIIRAIKLIEDAKTELEMFQDHYAQNCLEANTFINRVNDLMRNDDEMSFFDVDCFINIPDEFERQNQEIKVLQEIENFVNILINNTELRFLNDLDINSNEALYKELGYLNVTNLMESLSLNENATISITKLCEINGILNVRETEEELREFVYEFHRHVRTQHGLRGSLINNNLFNEDDRYYLLIDDDDTDDEIFNIIEVDPEFEMCNEKQCDCVECILKFINENHEREEKYHNVNKIYKYLAVLPCTQVKCERDFSKLKVTKNRLRSTLTNTNLSNLMIISTENNMLAEIDINNIVDEIAVSSKQFAKILL